MSLNNDDDEALNSCCVVIILVALILLQATQCRSYCSAIAATAHSHRATLVVSVL